MANDKYKQEITKAKQDVNDSEQNNNRPVSTTAKPQSRRPIMPLAKIIYFILITCGSMLGVVAFICALYEFNANFNLQQIVGKNYLYVNTQLEKLENIDKLQLQIVALQEREANLQTEVKSMKQSLQAALQQQSYQAEDWLYREAKYYLELAQINAHWNRNPQTTIALLKAADTILGNITNQSIFNIRQAIATEIAELQALPAIDRAGILSQLDAAQNILTQLPFKSPIKYNKTNNIPNPSKHIHSWHDYLQDSLSALKTLIIVRRPAAPIQPLLSQKQQAIIINIIKLNIQEAQSAVLLEEEAIYKITLNQALHAINYYFDDTASSTQSLIKQLQALKIQQISTVQPRLTKSLPMLIHTMENKTVNPAIAPPIKF